MWHLPTIFARTLQSLPHLPVVSIPPVVCMVQLHQQLPLLLQTAQRVQTTTCGTGLSLIPPTQRSQCLISEAALPTLACSYFPRAAVQQVSPRIFVVPLPSPQII